MFKTSRAWGLAPFTLALAPLAAQTLVKDINTNLPDDLEGSSPQEMVFAGGLTFFTAEGEGTGRELFVSDGTQGGTTIVVDLVEGLQSSNPSNLTAVGNVVYFTAVDSLGQFDLYQSDGTAQGTAPFVSDIPYYSPNGLFAHNGLLYFRADPEPVVFIGDYELWVSDGTASGTFPLTVDEDNFGTIKVGEGNYLYYTAGADLWRTDGTLAGIELVADVMSVRDVASANGTIWFFDLDGPLGGSPPPTWSLWKSDGTLANTTLVKELGNLKPKLLTANDTGVIFTGGSANVEPYVSDGTELGTGQLLEINDGDGSDPQDFTPFGGNAFVFTANDGMNGRELWYTGGTAGNTYLIKNLAQGFSSSPPVELIELNGEVFFRADDGVSGKELYKTDGTANGTVLVANLHLMTDSNPTGFASDGSQIWFQANGQVVGSELYVADGTGAALVADIGPNVSSAPTDFAFMADLNGKLIFQADDGNSGTELWVSDGTDAGTMMLADINPGFQGISVQSHAVFEEWLFVSASFDLNWRLWRTDGTPGGTQQVSPGLQAFNLHASNGKLFFAGDEPNFGREPWVLASKLGTPELLVDVHTGDSYASGFFTFGDKTVFRADSDARGDELWISDGTPAGTMALADINPGVDDSSPGGFTIIGDELFFTARTGFDFNIWSTDGTPAGTQLRLDLDSALGTDEPRNLLADDGWIYFQGGFDFDLFAYQPSTETSFAAGTDFFEVDLGFDIVQGRVLFTLDDEEVLQSWSRVPGVFETLSDVSADSQSIHYEVDGNTAFVQAGNELLTTDGTLAGTTFIAEVAPDPLIFSTTDVGPTSISSDERVLLQGYDFVNGWELWVADGDDAAVLADIDPGPSNSFPAEFFRAGDLVYFVADDGLTGRELHAVPVATTGGYVSEAFGTSCPMTTGDIPHIGSSGSPTVGSVDYTIDYESAPAGSTALLFYSAFRGVGTLGGGCALYFGTPFFLYPGFAVTGLDGRGSLAAPIPNDPGLTGVALYFQYLVLDPGGLIFGSVAPTDGLEVVLGP